MVEGAGATSDGTAKAGFGSGLLRWPWGTSGPWKADKGSRVEQLTATGKSRALFWEDKEPGKGCKWTERDQVQVWKE